MNVKFVTMHGHMNVKFVTMHGHMNVKKIHGRPISDKDLYVTKIYSTIQNNFGFGTKII
jgi:hypothetical protein